MDERKEGQRQATPSSARENRPPAGPRAASSPSISLQHPQQRIVSSSTHVQTDRRLSESRPQPYQQRGQGSHTSQSGAPSVRLDMDLEIEIEMKAKINGTILLSFENGNQGRKG
ncbi:hypothetical protein F5X68DRAFT_218870 [Plectosphaerella plurivora]|uniref:Uncharacterized protein n=1 Tax=Plectosphaerella plurivora TaxID=936078 RepID=A0A9P8UZY7_9PEZI|nr:hypothetical protein F5X68DRAFT_218870 [Plectosphaerella plurivora]